MCRRDPLTGTWVEKGQIKTPFDTFALDATTFVHQGKRWYLWAQKAPDISGNSNLYLCEMENPWTLKGEPVMLSKPEYDWECRGFWVNEGPAVLVHGDKLFISYSASATDENYCMGLLWIDLNADPQNPANWHKSRARYSPPAMKIASTARATTALRKRRKGKMCWCITRGTTPKLRATRCTIRIAIPA
jgi:GH43 family beta-xylosidase